MTEKLAVFHNGGWVKVNGSPMQTNPFVELTCNTIRMQIRSAQELTNYVALLINAGNEAFGGDAIHEEIEAWPDEHSSEKEETVCDRCERSCEEAMRVGCLSSNCPGNGWG